jgi:hypothetical protein
LRIELEALRNQVSERVMEYRESLGDMPPSGYDIYIVIPELPPYSMGKGNSTQRGPP